LYHSYLPGSKSCTPLKNRPDRYGTELFGCAISFTFPVIKLLDFDREGIEEQDNPFAIVTRVQLAKLKSEKDPDAIQLQNGSDQRIIPKKLHYTKEQVVRLYRFIDYILTLPAPKALQFKKELELFEESRKMPYITSTERIAREEGMLQGVQQGQLKEAQKAVLKVLEVRFGNIPYRTKEKITYCDDLNRLEKCLQEAVLIKSLTEFGLP
jgi:hypothetical protein